ncbi:MAG: hypothetical protein V7K41_13035, partial [Nostoc sp.]
MENFELKENGEWGMGSGEWGAGEQGSQGEHGEQGENNHAPSPMPKMQLLLHLVPIVGFFPSLWMLYRGQGSREQLAISRLSITLALTWLLS